MCSLASYQGYARDNIFGGGVCGVLGEGGGGMVVYFFLVNMHGGDIYYGCCCIGYMSVCLSVCLSVRCGNK